MYFVWEPSELKKSPYKMYERNPHTKCMRVVLSAEVKSAEAISKNFKEAVRLVVLVQTSSASIERVFSEVKRILASVGDSILEDNLELRPSVSLRAADLVPWRPLGQD